VRVLPATPESTTLAARVASQIGAVWSGWGDVERFGRRGGVWGAFHGDHEAHALFARVPGLGAVAPAIEGWVLHTYVRGPDTIAHLARVELLAPSDRPPVDQLAQADADALRRREARQRGEPAAPEAAPRAIDLDQFDVRRLCLERLPGPSPSPRR
jgi:hypothetical protein